MNKQHSSNAFSTSLLAAGAVLAALATGAYGDAHSATTRTQAVVVARADAVAPVRVATLPTVTITGRRATTQPIVEWPTVTVVAHRHAADDEGLVARRDSTGSRLVASAN